MESNYEASSTYPSSQPGSPQTQRLWRNKSSLTKRRDTYDFINPFRFKNRLRSKVVVVTLAHRGIGRASAIAFAQAGASVCCVGPDPQSLEPVLQDIKERYNTPTLALALDLLEPTAPAHIVQITERKLGPIDVLVNITPAIYYRPFNREPDINTDWWPSLERNLRAPIALTHAVLSSMTTRGTGIIISTVSTVAVLDFPFMSSQGVAKAGLLKFHQQLDVETRSKGILSFAVNPGPIPSHIHDPNMSVFMDPEHFARESGFQSELTSIASGMDWAAAGLASGTFVALCAEPKARMLSGLYIEAERDMGELLVEMEKDPGRVKRERLYVLKVDEI